MFLFSTVAQAADFQAIRLVDRQGAPFACATLETVNHVRWRTDTGGYAAIYEPGLMGELVWITPSGPFDGVPVDWLGIAGFQLPLVEGALEVWTLDRTGPDPACPIGDREQQLLAHGVPTPAEMHQLQVVDSETGLPVPAVRLTVGLDTWWTDNGGRVAWFDPVRMDDTVRFDVWTHGYTHPTGFVEVVPSPGGLTTIEIDRVNLAERLVRLTGGGLWRDTLMLGLPAPLAEPVLDGQVFGQDTAHAVEWRDGLFWLWGDTNRPSYPLGNFHTSGAWATLDPTPEDGVDLEYYEDASGFSKPIAPSYAEGPVWLGGLVALDDDELWAAFVNVDADFTALHDGMVRWNDGAEEFREIFQWPGDQVVKARGPAIQTHGPDGDWVMFRDLVRAPATPEALGDPASYEAWTPMEPDGTGAYRLATTEDGVPDWRWRSDAPPPDLDWVDLGYLPESASPWHRTFEPDTGESPAVHAGTIAWNPWRGRWIHVFTESFGSTSLIGEIWYAEGDTPVGPWSWARKVITHDNYSFYNPYFHPWFSERGTRRVLFEGTYTAWLGSDLPTPRHDYNQFFYALDLDDAPLALPVPFYGSVSGPVPRHDATADAPMLFGAQDQPGEGRIAVHWTAAACAPDRDLDPAGDGEVAFWALPAGTSGPGLADLVEWTGTDGTEVWSTADLSATGASPGSPIATVWAPLWAPPVPLSLYPLPERADAGEDQCGVASPVTLDGRGSVLTDGIVSWTWRWDGGEASGETVDLALPVGIHVVTLEISGPSGDAVDTVVVDVGGSSGTTTTTPPTDPPPDDPTVIDGEDPSGGCGCQTSRVGGALALIVAAVLVAGRRRRELGASAEAR